MATYDLDQTALNDLLTGNLSALSSSPPAGAVAISGPTELTLIDSLINAGLYPKPGLQVDTSYQVDSGTVSVDLSTIYGGGPSAFFLELGTGATISVTGSEGAVIATGDGNNQINDLINSDDTLMGGAGQDTLIGGGASDLIAGSGSNKLYGQTEGNTAASDTLQGGSGDDTLQVYTGNNLLIGGTGHDAIYSGAGKDTIYGTSGHDSITTAAGGHTTIHVGSGETTIGNDTAPAAGHDTIYIGYATNYSVGAGGSDTIYADGTSNTVVHVDTNYLANVTSPKTLANGDKLIVFSNGSVTTNVEINGSATIDYLNKTTHT